MSPSPLAAYVLLFVAVGAAFLFVHLVAGWMIRPSNPDAEKGTIYECGEPTIGSAWIQFDLRFYVVALLFVVFDVEVAFFFPWAEVFGKANAVANAPEPNDLASARDYARKVLALSWQQPAHPRESKDWNGRTVLWANNQRRYREVLQPERSWDDVQELITPADRDRDREAARNLAWLALGEVLLFFGVLLVGFAYLWRRGDLAWVRSTSVQEALASHGPAPSPAPREFANV